MANEFKVKNGLVVNGATTITGSVVATTGFTGSLSGTASYATYALNATVDTGSFATTGSNTFKGAQTFQNNVTIQGTASIAYLNVTYESASIIYSTGSNQLGDATNDTQLLIGTTKVSGSFEVTGSANFINGITGSLLGTASTASYVQTAQTASYVVTAQTASYVLQAVSASFATLANNASNLNGQAASYYLNASNINAGTIGNSYLPSQINVTGVTASFLGTASYASMALSSSFASTASYVLTAQTASYVLTAKTASYFDTTNLNQNVVVNSGYYLQVNSYSKTFSGNVPNMDSIGSPWNVVQVNFTTYPHKSIFVRYVLDDALTPGANMRAGNIMVVSDGSANINLTEVTTQDIGNTTPVDFTAAISSGKNQVRATVTSGTWNVYFDYTII